MTGRSRSPAGLLLAGAVALLLVVGAAVGSAAVGTRLAATGVPQGGMVASVAESAADLPEVWAATEEGDILPSTVTDVGPLPVPASTAGAVSFTRILKPVLPPGPRRVGIQAGHWLTEQAPPELWRLLAQTGTSWAGITETQINLDIAQRVKAILEGQGLVVDVLPTVIPPGYVADAFVALHGDGDGTGENSGFKMAISSRRTPYEAKLMESIKSEYAAATGLPFDSSRITRGMINYYAMSWQRNRYSTAPHTPSVILEMGYVSNEHDRTLLTERADVVARAVAAGIVRFIDEHSREELFGEDLLVPARPLFRGASPSPAR